MGHFDCGSVEHLKVPPNVFPLPSPMEMKARSPIVLTKVHISCCVLYQLVFVLVLYLSNQCVINITQIAIHKALAILLDVTCTCYDIIFLVSKEGIVYILS